MKKMDVSFGENNLLQWVPDSQDELSSPEAVHASWSIGNIMMTEETEGAPGLRYPQIGAIYSALSHWTTTNEPATIVMPTGTGKTETMIGVIVQKKCQKVLAVVPSDLLRTQLADKFCSLGILKTIGIIDDKIQNPVTLKLSTTPESLDVFQQLVGKSNVIVTTIALANRLPIEFIQILKSQITNVFIDEAHHVEASSWQLFKSNFIDKHILQFTATPFRNDKQRVDGQIIYNYPLRKAQKEGYFKHINFVPLYEFDEDKADYAIACKAVEQLEQDEKNNYVHLILVRTDTISRAEILYKEVYKKHFSKYNPVIITSRISETRKQKSLEDIRAKSTRIVVCVDMFGEGIDIPALKIAAIHDKYQSLAITLQFIGRFARTQDGLGDASVIANLANDQVSESISELYSEDADWNVLMDKLSSEAIGKEISLQSLARGFSSDGASDLRIEQLKPKISAVAFHTESTTWNPYGWKNSVFPEGNCVAKVNEEKRLLVIIEKEDQKVDWSQYKGLTDSNWQLHIVYWNESKKVFFINSTDKTVHTYLAKSIFSNSTIIEGESVFRCLYGINRLMFSTVGLKSIISGPIRYKMFAGIDVADGITQINRANNTKSNLFGVGYDGKRFTSIGCSYKGRIWSHWVESLDFWCKWCDEIVDKLLNNNLSSDDILRGILKPEIVDARPRVVPCSIEWPEDFYLETERMASFILPTQEFSMYETDMKLLSYSEDGPIQIAVSNESFEKKYELRFDQTKAYFVCLDTDDIEIHIGKNQERLAAYFTKNPPYIKFVDLSVLEGNVYVRPVYDKNVRLNANQITSWVWAGTDITKESQEITKRADSIQFRLINELKKDAYDVIFDDDNAGEIADVITVKICPDVIKFHLYHCKYSSEASPGARVDDLYVVCGQAQKSVVWATGGTQLINRMLVREGKRKRNHSNSSRFEVGDAILLTKIQRMLKLLRYEMDITVVQPGVDASKITDAMHVLLGNTQCLLKETYGVDLWLICS